MKLSLRSLRAADAFIRRARADVAPDNTSAAHTGYQLGFQAGYRAAIRQRSRSTTTCKHEHGSGLMDTNGHGEFTCHDCGDVLVQGRGLQPQPSREPHGDQ